MATGDKSNSNLFGTNFNDDDKDKDKDKEKEAQLAAQNVRIGAPPIEGQNNELPAYGEILDSRALPFSNEAKFPINERMGEGSPTGVDSNIVSQVPGIENIRNPGAFDPETGYLGNIKPGEPIMSTGTVEQVTPNSLVVNKISDVVQGLKDTVGTESVSMEDYQARQATQAPSGLSDLAATPSITPPVERPMAGAQEQPGAVVSPFLQSPDTPSGLGGPLLRGFEMVNEAARGPNAPMGQDATRAALGGMTLNEYLSAPAGTEGVSGLRTDPQGRMIPGSNTVGGPTTRAEAFPGYESEVAKAQARLSERDIRPGETQAQRDTRIQRDQSIVSGQTGGQLSQADLRDLAQASMKDATEGKVARGLQIQQRAGLGQFKPDSTGGLTFEQKLAQDKFEFDVNKFNFDQAREASDEATANARSATAAKFAVRDQLRQGANVMDKAQRAGKNIGFFTTGATGALFGLVAGTGAYDQKATVETLEADAAFSALQRMRDASKTGGALGNVSERELDLLKATAGSLRVGQSEEQFRANLGQYVERYNEAMLNIYDAFVADYGEKDANEAFKVNGRQDLIPQQGDNQSTSGGTTTETASGRYSVTVL